eukprot:3611865-Ditylum_brightwellii.AAC.1
MHFKRKGATSEEMSALGTDKKRPISAMVAHSIMGHINEADCRKAVQHLEHTISRGSMEKCVACAKSKAKQKSLPTGKINNVLSFLHDSTTFVFIKSATMIC